jgi:putative flavoprotein involved in K+ transport
MSMRYDTLVIGAGQAGLATGYQLGKTGLSFALLEAGDRPTGSWPAYYESLTLFSPARFSSLPGMPFPGSPDHYPERDEVIDYLISYAQRFHLPVIPQSPVERVFKEGAYFQVETSGGECFQARSVIAATGSFHQPYIPTLPGQETFQGQILHAAAYRSPEAFRDQRVVVVGAGNSAVQIAVELAKHAQVTLASRSPINFFPQLIGGRDVHFWMWATYLDRLPLGNWWERHAKTTVLDTGRYQQAFRDGQPSSRSLFEVFTADGVMWADGGHEPVQSVIFATGYRPGLDYLWELGALDEHGRALSQAGVSLTTSGLYFVGQQFQRTYASATLRGVGADAAWVVNHLRHALQRSSSHKPQMWRLEDWKCCYY